MLIDRSPFFVTYAIKLKVNHMLKLNIEPKFYPHVSLKKRNIFCRFTIKQSLALFLSLNILCHCRLISLQQFDHFAKTHHAKKSLAKNISCT